MFLVSRALTFKIQPTAEDFTPVMKTSVRYSNNTALHHRAVVNNFYRHPLSLLELDSTYICAMVKSQSQSPIRTILPTHTCISNLK